MKAAEAHSLQDTELVEAIRDARESSFNLRFRHATGELEDTSSLARTRRELARLTTVAVERGIDIEREIRALDRQ